MKIYLTGFMGAGKSFFAQRLSILANLNLYDIDSEIEREAGVSIDEIFSKKGETFFRLMEKEQLTKIPHNCVIATGGGILNLEENRNYFRNENATIIWIDVCWEIISIRIHDSKRPLVKRKKENELFELWKTRRKTYEEFSHLTLKDSSYKNIFKLLRKIREKDMTEAWQEETYDTVFESTYRSLLTEIEKNPLIDAETIAGRLKYLYMKNGSDWTGRGIIGDITDSAIIAANERIYLELKAKEKQHDK